MNQSRVLMLKCEWVSGIVKWYFFELGSYYCSFRFYILKRNKKTKNKPLTFRWIRRECWCWNVNEYLELWNDIFSNWAVTFCSFICSRSCSTESLLPSQWSHMTSCILVNNGSDITWTNTDFLAIGLLGANSSEILVQIQPSLIKKRNTLKVSSARCRPWWPFLNVFINRVHYILVRHVTLAAVIGSTNLVLHFQVMSHYGDVIMGAMASQITTVTTVYSTVYSDVDQRKYQRSASLAFVRGIHRWPVNAPHKWPATRKCFYLMTSWRGTRRWNVLVNWSE